jgi:hypothetical protein
LEEKLLQAFACGGKQQAAAKLVGGFPGGVCQFIDGAGNEI